MYKTLVWYLCPEQFSVLILCQPGLVKACLSNSSIPRTISTHQYFVCKCKLRWMIQWMTKSYHLQNKIHWLRSFLRGGDLQPSSLQCRTCLCWDVQRPLKKKRPDRKAQILKVDRLPRSNLTYPSNLQQISNNTQTSHQIRDNHHQHCLIINFCESRTPTTLILRTSVVT
jgi:hypothetical protein